MMLRSILSGWGWELPPYRLARSSRSGVGPMPERKREVPPAPFVFALFFLMITTFVFGPTLAVWIYVRTGMVWVAVCCGAFAMLLLLSTLHPFRRADIIAPKKVHDEEEQKWRSYLEVKE